jgi:protein PhnA
MHTNEMSIEPKCPQCDSKNIYNDGVLWICPECTHEWTLGEPKVESDVDLSSTAVKDAHGNVLKDGDAVTVIKDLKVNGASSSVKAGTRVKNIRIIAEENGHNIGCKIDGFGAMNLKSEFVKKA